MKSQLIVVKLDKIIFEYNFNSFILVLQNIVTFYSNKVKCTIEFLYLEEILTYYLLHFKQALYC